MTTERGYLIEDLANEVSREYASVFGMMAGMAHRFARRKAEKTISNADYRSGSGRVAGLRMACETLLRLERPGIYPDELEAQIKSHIARWKEAAKKDEEKGESA
jgi:hypothetical protein